MKSTLRDRLKHRTKENINKIEGGTNKKSYLDFSKIDGEIEFYKPKIKTNMIDILPYIVSTENHPSFKKGEVDYLLDIWVHYNIGINDSSVVCLKKTYSKPCPICEEISRLFGEGEKTEAEKLYAKRRCIYNIIDLNGEDEDIKIFDVSHFLFEKEMLEELEMLEEKGKGEEIVFSDPEDGKSIRFRATEQTLNNNNFLKYKSFSFKDREPYPESIIEKTISLDDLLVVLSYDKINNLFLNIDDDEKGDNDKEENKLPLKSKKKRKIEEDKKENRCPNNYSFGNDCDEYDECTDCEIWDECSDEYDKK